MLIHALNKHNKMDKIVRNHNIAVLIYRLLQQQQYRDFFKDHQVTVTLLEPIPNVLDVKELIVKLETDKIRVTIKEQ